MPHGLQCCSAGPILTRPALEGLQGCCACHGLYGCCTGPTLTRSALDATAVFSPAARHASTSCRAPLCSMPQPAVKTADEQEEGSCGAAPCSFHARHMRRCKPAAVGLGRWSRPWAQDAGIPSENCCGQTVAGTHLGRSTWTDKSQRSASCTTPPQRVRHTCAPPLPESWPRPCPASSDGKTGMQRKVRCIAHQNGSCANVP